MVSARLEGWLPLLKGRKMWPAPGMTCCRTWEYPSSFSGCSRKTPACSTHLKHEPRKEQFTFVHATAQHGTITRAPSFPRIHKKSRNTLSIVECQFCVLRPANLILFFRELALRWNDRSRFHAAVSIFIKARIWSRTNFCSNPMMAAHDALALPIRSKKQAWLCCRTLLPKHERSKWL